MDRIDRLDPHTTSYIDWFCDYLLANKPCVFTSDITKEWKACKQWRKDDGSPAADFLIADFGDAVVPVVDLRQFSGYDSQTQSSMKLRDFLSNRLGPQSEAEGSCSYLKDWHFVKDYPSYDAYQLPIYFQNDWMNEYWDTKNDAVESDYRFVYIGGNGTWTPFHADVFRSHSWSANVCGQKRWLLVRPRVEVTIQRYWEKVSGGSPASIAMNDIRPILQQHPELFENADVLDVIQKPGEIIYVPSNWHHQVHNVGEVISINHNWCNGANIRHVWQYLSDRLEAVKKELSDCRSVMDSSDWFAQCQVVLKCDAGMDFYELLSMLSLITEKRLQRLHTRSKDPNVLESLFHCDFCDNSLVACSRTSNCLRQLKARLKANCKCDPSSPSSRCDFCFAFFGIFDILAATFVAKTVLASEDAAILPAIMPLWRKRLQEIESKVHSYLS